MMFRSFIVVAVCLVVTAVADAQPAPRSVPPAASFNHQAAQQFWRHAPGVQAAPQTNQAPIPAGYWNHSVAMQKQIWAAGNGANAGGRALWNQTTWNPAVESGSQSTAPFNRLLSLGIWNGTWSRNSVPSLGDGPLARLFQSLASPWSPRASGFIPENVTVPRLVAAPVSLSQLARWLPPVNASQRRYRYYAPPRLATPQYVFSPRPFGTGLNRVPDWKRYTIPRQRQQFVVQPNYVAPWQPAPSPWQPHVALLPVPVHPSRPISRPVQPRMYPAAPSFVGTSNRLRFSNRLPSAGQAPPASWPAAVPMTVQTAKVQSPIVRRPSGLVRPSLNRLPMTLTEPPSNQLTKSLQLETKPSANPVAKARASVAQTAEKPATEKQLPPRRVAAKSGAQPNRGFTPNAPPQTLSQPHRNVSRRVARSTVTIVSPAQPKPIVSSIKPTGDSNPVSALPGEKNPVATARVKAEAKIDDKANVVSVAVNNEISTFKRSLGLNDVASAGVPGDDLTWGETPVAKIVNGNDAKAGAMAWLANCRPFLSKWLTPIRTKTIQWIPGAEPFFSGVDNWPVWWPAVALMPLLLLNWVGKCLARLRREKIFDRERGVGLNPEAFRFEGGVDLPSSQRIVDPYPEVPAEDTTEYFQPDALTVIGETKSREEVAAVEPAEQFEEKPVALDGYDANPLPEDQAPFMEEYVAAEPAAATFTQETPDPFLAYMEELEGTDAPDSRPSEAATESAADSSVNRAKETTVDAYQVQGVPTEALFDSYVANLKNGGEADSETPEASPEVEPLSEEVEPPSSERIEADLVDAESAVAELAAMLSNESVAKVETANAPDVVVEAEPQPPVESQSVVDSQSPVEPQPPVESQSPAKTVPAENAGQTTRTAKPSVATVPATRSPTDTKDAPPATVTKRSSDNTVVASQLPADSSDQSVKTAPAGSTETELQTRRTPGDGPSAPTIATGTQTKSSKTKTKPLKGRPEPSADAKDVTQPSGASARAANAPPATAQAVAPTPKTKPIQKRSRPTKPKGGDASGVTQMLAGGSDDLTRIYGLTVSAVRTLEKSGINSFRDLAGCTPKTIQDMLAEAGSRFCKVDPTSWPEQAALAAAGNWSELKLYAN